jgi:hypothetical protein
MSSSIATVRGSHAKDSDADLLRRTPSGGASLHSLATRATAAVSWHRGSVSASTRAAAMFSRQSGVDAGDDDDDSAAAGRSDDANGK